MALSATFLNAAQAPAPVPEPQVTRQAPPATRVRPPDYPVRSPGDPAIIARGKQIFSVDCSFCHGSDARGGESGPNLVRSQLVLDDQQGELIAPVVQNGRLELGMPKFDMSVADISAIATFLHSLPQANLGGAPSAPINILVGDAKAGEAYFTGSGKCNTCHSVTGDLAGIGAKLDPKTLQNLIVSGGGGRGGGGAPSNVPPATVTVTLLSGQKFEGKLTHIDAFTVSLAEADGTHRSFAIDNATPKVEVHNPLRAHIDMLPILEDSDIHNLTAYLVTLK